MKTNTKAERTYRLFSALADLGFTFEESQQLRRIEMTLHRWAELECGDGNDYASWSIERDETTGKPYLVTHPHTGKSYRRAVADRERGALKRLAAIVDARNARLPVDKLHENVQWYHQGDPRGAALYIVRTVDIPEGAHLEAFYTRGLCVAA